MERESCYGMGWSSGDLRALPLWLAVRRVALKQAARPLHTHFLRNAQVRLSASRRERRIGTCSMFWWRLVERRAKAGKLAAAIAKSLAEWLLAPSPLR